MEPEQDDPTNERIASIYESNIQDSNEIIESPWFTHTTRHSVFIFATYINVYIPHVQNQIAMSFSFLQERERARKKTHWVGNKASSFVIFRFDLQKMLHYTDRTST